MLRNKIVLITGAAGFIGSAVLRRCLIEGMRVHCIIPAACDNWRIQEALKQVKIHHVDLLEEEKLAETVSSVKPEIVFHLAAYGVYGHENNSRNIIRTNFEGTVNLVNSFSKDNNFPIFVNTGSVFEYGSKKNILRESDILEPATDYGISKAAATIYCQGISRRENLPITTLRLFTPYGYYEAESRLIPSVIISCLKRISPKVSDPGILRNFIFIDDVVEAYIKAVKNIDQAKGQVINIAGTAQHALKEVVEEIIRLSGANLNVEWRALEARNIEMGMFKADIGKARKLLAWQPVVNLESGLKNTVSWFKNNIHFYNRVSL
jgi:nucleoside-diphosphate-sugar epimerase